MTTLEDAVKKSLAQFSRQSVSMVAPGLATEPTYAAVAAVPESRSAVRIRIPQAEGMKPAELLSIAKQKIEGAYAVRQMRSNNTEVFLQSSAQRDAALSMEQPENFKILRQDYHVEVMGVPISTKINGGKEAKNEDLINSICQVTRARIPSLAINRIRWLHNEKEQSQEIKMGYTRGSIVLSLPTESLQWKVVRYGVVIDPILYAAQLWSPRGQTKQCFLTVPNGGIPKQFAVELQSVIMALRTLEIRNSKSSIPEVLSGNKTTPEFTVVTEKNSEARRGPGRSGKEQAAPTASLIPVSSPISVKATPPHEGTIQASSTQRNRFNCGASNYGILRPFMDMLDPEKHLLVVLQEPSVNKTSLGTYCPKGYWLCMEPKLETKVAFLISKCIGESSWSYKWLSNFVTEVTLDFDGKKIRVVNVHSPVTGGPELVGLNEILEAINQDEVTSLLLGDFNCHHSYWGGVTAPRDTRAQKLLNATSAQGFHLATVPGIPTFRRRGAGGGLQETVIDLTFTSKDLVGRIEFCSMREDWSIRLDHIPIEINLSLDSSSRSHIKRFAVQKADLDLMRTLLRESGWHKSREPLTALQDSLIKALQQHCQRAHSSPYAKPAWSIKATELLAATRQACRQAKATGEIHDEVRSKALRRKLKKEIDQVRRSSWRNFVAKSTSDIGDPSYKGLWRLSRWAKKQNGVQLGPPHLPALRWNSDDTPTHDNSDKAKILQEKFFPNRVEADLSDITANWHRKRTIEVRAEVTPAKLEDLLRQLPTGKSPGPDEIPNEILKLMLPEWKSEMAPAITATLHRRPDYSVPSSYRPIALENTLAKLVEKVVTDRIATAAEEDNIIPWVQIGPAPIGPQCQRWNYLLQPYSQHGTLAQTVVSMLGLDIKGAFDNISKQRLLWVLRREGFPDWIVRFINSFVSQRRTKIRFTGYTSDWILTEAGMPQGSHLSLILFLLYISELLESLQKPDKGHMAFGFMDDTTLVAWGKTPKENCTILEQAHEKFLACAKRYGATFAPEKYQLVHFSRKKKNSGSLQEGVQVGDIQISPRSEMKVLGVVVDSHLRWGALVAQAARNGEIAYNALSRITASVWGPSLRHSQLVYLAVVHPTMLYGAQIWGMKSDGQPMAKSLMDKPGKIQSKCLRKITRGYKRTPRLALEREAAIPPIDLQVQSMSLLYGANTAKKVVTIKIYQHVNDVWQRIRPLCKKRNASNRKKSAIEAIRQRAVDIDHEMKVVTKKLPRHPCLHPCETKEQRKADHITGPKTWVNKWMDLQWQQRCSSNKGNRSAET
ncbi:hypothetical protein K3495_g934 [Podosphaera aphanis]|nr:hypothetical protein K3495_g934 [Podosphaera aphanis]